MSRERQKGEKGEGVNNDFCERYIRRRIRVYSLLKMLEIWENKRETLTNTYVNDMLTSHEGIAGEVV